MTNNLLILGGGGFIGTTFYQKYKDSFSKIIVFDWFKGPTHHNNNYLINKLKSVLRKKDLIINDDIFNIQSYKSILKDIDNVIILNADTGTGNSFYEPYQNTLYNSSILTYCFEFFNKNNFEFSNIIYTSSRAVYGEGNWYTSEGKAKLSRTNYLKTGKLKCDKTNKSIFLKSFEENQPLNPLSVYGLNKVFSESFLKIINENHDVNTSILRFQNVYGVGQSMTNPYTGVLNWFSSSFSSNSTVEIYEKGLIQRDFVHVNDVVDSIYLSIKNNFGYNIYNIGSGKPVDLTEVAQKLKFNYNSKSKIKIVDKYRNGDVLGAFSDNKKASKLLKYKPKVKLDSGLEEYCAWFKSEYRV
jgi:dTDP-L-rhamnose 4-epimerase